MTKLLFVAFFAIVLTRSSGQTADSSQAGDMLENRHAVYLELKCKVYARHLDLGSGQLNHNREKEQAAGEQLNKMIGSEVQRALNLSGASSASVTASVAALQGELSLSAYDPHLTNTPFVKFFDLGGLQTVAVAYVIMRGADAIPDTRPHLALYDKSSGEWQEKAAAPAPTDFRACTFFVSQLNAGISGEAWFLTWGQAFGSSHGSKEVRLYAFDGNATRTIWLRHSLDGGRITAASDTVTIDYLDQNDPSIERHEVFHVAPDGLALVSESSRTIGR